MQYVTTQTICRICKSPDLVEFLDLGTQPLANSFLRKDEDTSSEFKVSLRVMFCQGCNLCQLGEVVDPEVLFRDYVYFSSGMPSSPHYTAYADDIVRRFISSPDEYVVEIGSNDGHLLREIQKRGARILGVDPARNIALLASANGIETLPEFFSEKIAREIRETRGAANVIIGNNVVAHIDNHHDLAAGIAALLADNGVFVLEAPYLADMFERLSFDTVYHEHLSYLALRPLQTLFRQYGMEIFDVGVHPVQGNSLRVYAAKQDAYAIQPSVQAMVQKELTMGFDKLASYQELACRIKALQTEVCSTVYALSAAGSTIACYGAPAKGNTLLNYFGLGSDIFSFATEELPSKIGLLTPGTHIPVISIADARKIAPDYYLLLAWNYKDVVLVKENNFRNHGGKFIMPVGDERII